MRKPAALGLLVAAAVLALSACGSTSPGDTSGSASSPSGSATSSGSSAHSTITIKDFKYQGPASVSAGEKITVKNDDDQAHTVTADTGDAFDVKVAPGATATFTAPDRAGSYAYHCTFHANMQGSLDVS